MATDPVCGMKVSEEQAAAKVEYESGQYYFCSDGCRDRFLENPPKFLPPPS